MKKVKFTIWIFIIFLIQTVIVSQLHIYGAVISLVLPFSVCVALLEPEFRSAATVIIICAAAAGALCGRSFAPSALFYVYFPFIVFALRDKPLYISKPFKAVFWTFTGSALMEIMFFFLRTMTVTPNMLLYDALPAAVIDSAPALVIYPLLKRIMYKEKEKKLLIGDLV